MAVAVWPVMRRVTLAVVSAVALSVAAVVIMAKNDVHCDLFYDGQWNDVTAADEVFARDPFGIVRGRADEVATAVPDSGTFTLDNRSGKYNPRNPVGELYGKFGENTPARVHIGTPHVGAATAESVAATSHVAPSVSSPTAEALLISVWANPDPANAYTVPASMTAGAGTTDARTTMKSAYQFITAAGPTGTRTATVGAAEEYAAASVLLHGQGIGIASLGGFSVVLDAASDAGDWWVVASYFGWDDTQLTATPGFPSDNDGGGWLLLADSGTGTWSDPQADFARMKVWAKRVKTTGSHQIKVGNPTGDLDSIQSVFYRLSGVTGWYPRLHGEAGSFKPGRAIKGPAWVNVGAFGPSMRLTQGEPPKESALTRFIRGSDPAAWWPLDDAADATAARSLVAGVTVLAPSGVVQYTSPGTGIPIPAAGAPDFAGGDAGPLLESPSVSLQSGGQLFGVLAQASTIFRIEISAKYRRGARGENSINQYGHTLLEFIFAGGSYPEWTLNVDDTSVFFDNRAVIGGGATGRAQVTFNPYDGLTHRYRIDLKQVGGDIEGKLYIDGQHVATSANFDDSLPPNGTLGDLYSVELPAGAPDDISGDHMPVAANHFTIWTNQNHNSIDAALGYPDEPGGRRFLRICREEDLNAAVAGDPDDTQPMGPQPVDTVAAQFADIEATDDALIGDAREFLGLRMRTGRSMAAQQPVLELDYNQFHIAPPLDPVIDDQGARNDITVKRRAGGEARAVQENGPRNVQRPQDDPQGVGRYRHTVNVNTAGIGELGNHAGWHRHKGTVDEIRWPQVTVDLLATPALADAVSAADQGDLITIDNLPGDFQAHQARLLIAGYSETIHTHRRLVTFNCVPASTRDAGVYGTDTIVSRYDSEHSTLGTGVDADDTSLSVATQAGHALWITSAAFPTHFPFDVRCAGIRLTVTAITSTSSPQTFTVLRNVDGIDKALAAGEQISLFQPAYYGL